MGNMNKMKTVLAAFSFTFFVSSCTPAHLKCLLLFKNYGKTFNFNFSKSELKNRIVEAYSYNESLLLQNLGKTLVENEQVNAKYRKSIDNWLDKQNWEEFRTEIRNNTSDTLNIIVGKHWSRKQIKLTAILNGDDQKSSLVIDSFEFQRKWSCKKGEEYYREKSSKKIEKKFINKLK